MKQFLQNGYKQFNKADYYIIGFIYGGNVYYIALQNIDDFVKLDRASRNNGYSLRLNLTKAAKIQLLECNPQYLCKANHFYKLVKSSNYNKGEIFEQLIFKKFRKKWKKDNKPFYICGDMTYKKKQIQIKFERATLCTEQQIKRLLSGF